MKKLFEYFYLLGSLMFFACTSSAGSTTAELPDWVLRTPEADSSYEYFVASGTDVNPTEAEEKATINLVSDITKYLGSHIKATSQTEISGEIDNLQRRVKNELSQSSNANIEKLKITEKYFMDTKAGITVYVLARYEKVALEREKQRLEKIALEKANSVKEAESTGDTLFAEHNFFESAKYFIKAASNAKLNNVDNGVVHFNRNIDKAKTSLEKINLTANHNGKNVLLQSNDKNLSMLVLYFAKNKTSSKERLIKESVLVEDGVYSFTLPDTLASNTIYFQLDEENLFNKLEQCGKEGRVTKKSLQSIVKEKQVTISVDSLKSQSQKANLAITVQVDNTSQLKNEFLQALQKKLLQAGYKVKNNSDYILKARLEYNTPNPDGDIFITNFTVSFSLFHNGELIQTDSLKKSSIGFTAKESSNATANLAADIVVRKLNLSEN